MSADNEQWLSGGDCTKCRRFKYCSKLCTVAKRRRTAEVNAAILDVATKVMRDALDKESNTELKGDSYE